MTCPKCKSENVTVQSVQTGTVGKDTYNAPKKKSCISWILGGWIIDLLFWIFIGWWKNLLFGKRRKIGTKTGWRKARYKTMAICQNCGHSWKV